MKKKQTNDQKIIAAWDAIDKSVRNLRKFSQRCEIYMDEAAIRGDDARAKQLIKQKISIDTFAKGLEAFKSNMEFGTYKIQAISELGKLNDAIAGCKGLLSESPDFTKLGKSIETILGDINASEAEFAKLNEIFDPKPVESITSRLDGTIADEVEQSDQFKAEYAAMIERVKGKIAPETVSKPNGTDVSSTGDIDYEGLMKKEQDAQD